MFVVKVILVICLCNVIKGNRLLEVKNQDENLANFVKSLIIDLDSQQSETHDVALLKLGKYRSTKRKVDEMFESVVYAIPKENLVITPKLSEVSRNRDMKKAAVIIIVSDVVDPVSKMFLKRQPTKIMKHKIDSFK
jgi:hypothetical protein